MGALPALSPWTSCFAQYVDEVRECLRTYGVPWGGLGDLEQLIERLSRGEHAGDGLAEDLASLIRSFVLRQGGVFSTEDVQEVLLAAVGGEDEVRRERGPAPEHQELLRFIAAVQRRPWNAPPGGPRGVEEAEADESEGPARAAVLEFPSEVEAQQSGPGLGSGSGSGSGFGSGVQNGAGRLDEADGGGFSARSASMSEVTGGPATAPPAIARALAAVAGARRQAGFEERQDEDFGLREGVAPAEAPWRADSRQDAGFGLRDEGFGLQDEGVVPRDEGIVPQQGAVERAEQARDAKTARVGPFLRSRLGHMLAAAVVGAACLGLGVYVGRTMVGDGTQMGVRTTNPTARGAAARGAAAVEGSERAMTAASPTSPRQMVRGGDWRSRHRVTTTGEMVQRVPASLPDSRAAEAQQAPAEIERTSGGRMSSEPMGSVESTAAASGSETAPIVRVPPRPAAYAEGAQQARLAGEETAARGRETRERSGSGMGSLDRPIQLPAGVMAHNLVSAPAPELSGLARLTHTRGEVAIAVLISRSGEVTPLQVLSGHRLLRGAAVRAVQSWTYRPYRVNGRPVEVETVARVNFSQP